MFRAKIKLVYKQEINNQSESAFEKAIFRTTYEEFLLKSREFNLGGHLKTFSGKKENDDRANSLHYKLNFSVSPWITQLNNEIPLISDNLGNKLSFGTTQFELIESHIEDITMHKVAVYYETAPLTLVEFMGEYLLLAHGNKAENMLSETFVLKMQPNLSIVCYRGIAHPHMAWIASQQ